MSAPRPHSVSDLALAVSHGEYTVSIMLGRRLADYVQNGFPEAGARP